MPRNPAYLEAEARVFRDYGLTPTVRSLALTQPPVRLRVADVGGGDPVVFLHGFSHCVALWAPLVGGLSGVRSVMLDLPGHGAADAVDFAGVDLRRWFTTLLTGCLDALGFQSGYATTVASELRELFRGIDAEPRRYALRDDELRGITPPVLVLWGEGDARFQPIAEARARAAVIPHSRFEVLAGEHTPWLDDPVACAGRMASLYAREHAGPSGPPGPAAPRAGDR